MAAAATRLRAAGARRWCLNVRPDNEPARRLYESVGMRPSYSAVALRLEWDRADRLPAPGPAGATVRAGPIPRVDDIAIEATMGLVLGQLADARTRPGRVLRQLRDGTDVVGVAIFDPDFPGAFPFRVRSLALCRTLLAALRPHARPEHDFVNLVIEDDEPLAQGLLAEGATERFRFVHYDGAVPIAPIA
jgi:hypothetical protein